MKSAIKTIKTLNDVQLNNREFPSLRNESTNSFDVLKKQHQIAANEALFSLVKGETFSYVLDYLVQSGADLNAMTEDGKYPIFHLLLKNDNFHHALFEAFLYAGVNVDIKDCNGDTMLHKIVSGNYKFNFDFLPELLDFQSDVNAQNNYGETPLHLAVKNQCDWYIIDWLLFEGSDWGIRDCSWHTPLTYANEELKNKIINYEYPCEE